MNVNRATDLLIVGISLFVVVGCSVTPLQPDATLLPTLNIQTISSTDKARDALATVAATRADIAYETRQAEIACYKVFYVNACRSNVDILRKRKEARLREIDLIAQQVIRNERAFEKNESTVKAALERELKAPVEALRRDQSVEKSQEKHATQAEKTSQLLARQTEDSKKEEESLAARKARQDDVNERSAKAKRSQRLESNNRAKYLRKLNAINMKKAKALEKQKLIDAKPVPAPRVAKPPKLLRAPKAAPK
jgi:hypothetical protein